MLRQRRCPSCGAPFDGKECSQCLYVTFDGDTAPVRFPRHGATAPQTKSRHDAAFPTATTPRRGRGKIAASFYLSFLVLRVLLIIITVTAVCAGLFGAVLSRQESRRSEEYRAEPEPAPTDFAAFELYSGNGIRLLADWDGGSIPTDMLCQIENNTDLDLMITTRAVAVNGMMLEGSHIYCDAASGKTESCTLWTDEAELDRLGIQDIETVSLILDLSEAETYDLVASTELLTFGPGLRTEVPEQNGLEIFESEHLRLSYQDVGVTEYGDRYVQFYGENISGEELVVMTEAVTANGTATDLGLYQVFFPDTAAVFRLYLYDFQTEELGDWDLDDLEALEITFWILPGGDFDREVYSDPIRIPLGGWL